MSSNAPQTDTVPSTCTLYRGDCLAVMPHLPQKSVQLVFSDLPYGVSKKALWDTPINLACLWQKLIAVSHAQAVFLFTCNVKLLTHLIDAQRTMFRYELIWQKNLPSNFMMGKKRPLLYHEYVAVFAHTSHRYNPQMRNRSASSAAANRGRLTFSGPHESLHLNYKKTSRQYDYNRKIYPGSILTELNEATRKAALHPTQKPVALLDWLIKSYTNQGDTVLDPAFGSATTAVACARLGRHFIGIEKDAEYFRIGTDRVNAERAKLGLQPCEVRI